MTVEASNASVVREFYEALSARDAETVRRVVREHFAEDATFTWPPSLPYGGTVVGRAKLERMLGGAAASPALVGAQHLRLNDLIDDGGRIAAQVEFDWYAPNDAGELNDTGAVEIWTFAAGLVSNVKAYYWDTAACSALWC